MVLDLGCWQHSHPGGGVFATSSREGLEEACGEAAGAVVSTAGDSGVGHPQAGSGPLAAVLLLQGSRCGDDSPTAVAAWVACRGQGGGCPAVTLSVLCLPRSGSEQHVDLHRRRGLRSRALESGVGQVQRLPLVPGPGEPGARGAGPPCGSGHTGPGAPGPELSHQRCERLSRGRVRGQGSGLGLGLGRGWASQVGAQDAPRGAVPARRCDPHVLRRQIIDPKMPRVPGHHNGVTIPAPPLDVLRAGEHMQTKAGERLFLVLFFDNKRSW